MLNVLDRFQEQIYALMRVVIGFLFACHGAQKVLGLIGGVDGAGGTVPLASRYGAAGMVELVGGLAVCLGLFACWGAFLSSGLMAVAYFMAHQPEGALPIQNGGELAAVYAFVFLFIAAKGDGVWSLGGALRKKG